MGQAFKVFILLHSVHIQRCPQLQNKTCGGLVRHITQSPVLNVWIELIDFLFKLFLIPI